ncbi:ketopantoate reductase family protein [Desmospora profundinema]|uniref:2-dehydropantoate 2-reductase n=1 Tax=Desmospora profundinema TaxID=1571184 RepID=A0ABU1IKY9_9BACL|nr:2-dehydropantoate 2-reductase [Desmospora profundinema]MDR6224814.1 2-dehydropantoate 2-reductase [Desmospora profundinema]
MRIMIWGSGALGLLWARRLHNLGADPVLITRTGRQRDRIREEGLIVTDDRGDVHRCSVPVFTPDDRLPRADWVWVMVKQTALDQVREQLNRACGPDSEVWLWQNGWHPQWPFTEGTWYWWNTVTTEGALRESENRVRHTGVGSTWVGSLLSPTGGPELKRLPGLDRWVFPDPHIRDRIWTKLAINCVINPLTAVWGVKNGQLLHCKEFPALAKGLLREAVEAARLQEVCLSFDTLWEQVQAVCRRTALNRSSMLQDVESGKKTEVDFINGAIVRTGNKAGIDFALNREMVERVRDVEGTKGK